MPSVDHNTVLGRLRNKRECIAEDPGRAELAEAERALFETTAAARATAKAAIEKTQLFDIYLAVTAVYRSAQEAGERVCDSEGATIEQCEASDDEIRRIRPLYYKMFKVLTNEPAVKALRAVFEAAYEKEEKVDSLLRDWLEEMT